MYSEIFYLLSQNKATPKPVARICFNGATAQLVSSGTTDIVYVAWDTFTDAYNGMTASSAGVVVPVAGVYSISGAITFSSSSTVPYSPINFGSIGISNIAVNTVIVSIGSGVTGITSSFVSDNLQLNAGDVVTLQAYGGPTGDTYIWGADGTYQTYMSIVLTEAT
jgi:hypothetical protein